MFNIFEYDFMQKAFVAGALIAIILPCIGQLVLIKRLSMIGDTLSHSSLAGLSIGLAFGISPILSAMIFCIFAAFSIEIIRNKLKNYHFSRRILFINWFKSLLFNNLFSFLQWFLPFSFWSKFFSNFGP